MTLEKKLVRLRKKKAYSKRKCQKDQTCPDRPYQDGRLEIRDHLPKKIFRLYNVKLADLLDKSNEETLIEKPECQKVKCDIERKDKEKRHVWAKRGVIAAMIRLWRFAIFWGI